MTIKSVRYDYAMFFWQDVDWKIVAHTEVTSISPLDILTPLLVAAKILCGRFYLNDCYQTLIRHCNQINSSSDFQSELTLHSITLTIV